MVEKTVELTGISSNSIEDAAQLAIARAGVTLAGIHTARITDISAVVDSNKVTKWRVTVKVTFNIQDQIHE
ncbi:MAG: dodecin family protein [Candidatus Binataceae bacterium]|jgi:flavin-binding protein dodecin